MIRRIGYLLPLFILLVGFAALSMAGCRLPVPEVGRDYVQRAELPTAAPFDLPKISGGRPAIGQRQLPLVVLDPGHGGFDPGASSNGLEEKTITLGLAKALRDRLLADGSVRVAMTRDDDRFLSLDERYEIARRLGADLFISIHADSAGDAGEVEGASVYTLSNAASSAAARRFALRENAADRVNGQDLGRQSDAVSALLVDLSQRRTQSESNEFADLIEREGKGVIDFHPQARRSAALEVLRAPDVPSVLFESGYITNASDAKRLTSRAGQEDFAKVVARAIRIFFSRHDRMRTNIETSGTRSAAD